MKMKTPVPTHILLFLTTFGLGGLATPTPNLNDDSSTTLAPGGAPHNASGAAVINPDYNVTTKDVEEFKDAAKCITFTSSDPGFHWANAGGVWGTATGTFGRGPKKICVPYSSSAGGAMFLGVTPNPAGGNTKLECFFPPKGTANCDMSLVDGYSLSVSCKAGGKNVGGGDKNLWKTGQKCQDQRRIKEGICLNDKGYAPKESDVTPFFQEGIKDGQRYCIWVNCSQDYFFPVTDEVECHVSGGRGPALQVDAVTNVTVS